MEEMYGLHSTPSDYADKFLLPPDNLIIPADYHYLFSPAGNRHRFPIFGSQDLISAASAISETASVTAVIHRGRREEDEADAFGVIKAKIASHPSYPKLLQAYIDCQKVNST